MIVRHEEDPYDPMEIQRIQEKSWQLVLEESLINILEEPELGAPNRKIDEVVLQRAQPKAVDSRLADLVKPPHNID